MLLGAGSLLLAGCGGQHTPDEKYYLVSVNIKVPYWQAANAGMMAAAKELGVQAELGGPDTYDPKAELEEFRRVAKLKPAGILVSAADAGMMTPDIDAAVDAGIPVITMDADATMSKRLTFIGTNNYDAGQIGGRLVVKLLNGKGNVVVLTMPGQANLDERLHGYQAVFLDHPGVKITEVVDIQGKPQTAFDTTAAMLDKDPKKVDAFVCLEAIAGKEVAEVVTRAKMPKTIVAMDTDQGTLEWVQKGVIAATVAQKPFTMGLVGTKMLDDLHHHPLSRLGANWAEDPFAHIPRSLDTGVTLIDKGSVDLFMKARDSATSGKS
ncbi:MAG TPA: substrate-binding domain-containing protein [Bryobacteraceae bacterium]|nr:substrate-binding domain-containing protein [Bryobacteraceae bacterium]